MTAKSSAPGNLFLGGDQAVVYGELALVASVDMRTYSSVKRRNDDAVKIFSEGYGKVDEKLEGILGRKFSLEDFKNDEMNLARSLIQRYHSIFSITSGFEMSVETDIPKNCSGLSRSTSFLCSAFDSLQREFGKKPFVPTPENYFHYILPLQEKIHGGHASGAEIFSSVLGGFHMVKNDGSKEFLGNPKFHVVIGDTESHARTYETVTYVRGRWEKDKESYEEVFHKIGDIVEEETRAIKNNNAVRLGELMNQNHEILARDLGVSHPKLNKLVDAARGAGAYGAKQSGGGAIMIALVDEDNESEVAKAIRNAGGTPYATEIGVEGLREEKNLKM